MKEEAILDRCRVCHQDLRCQEAQAGRPCGHGQFCKEANYRHEVIEHRVFVDPPSEQW